MTVRKREACLLKVLLSRILLVDDAVFSLRVSVTSCADYHYRQSFFSKYFGHFLLSLSLSRPFRSPERLSSVFL